MSKISFNDVTAAHRAHGSCTLLGIGPMSKNCVDTIIDISNKLLIPILVIASRRQIECAQFGGGYVNGWTTEEFARYVHEQDINGCAILCRDHGGPWQAPFEVDQGFELQQAMDSAKESYRIDILSDFKILQLDPSIDPTGQPDSDELLRRLFELWDFCVETAKSHGKDVYFEVGTEELNGLPHDLEEFEGFLKSVRQFCEERGYDLPVFVLGQTGTLLKEMKNIGTFQDDGFSSNSLRPEIHIPQLARICETYGFMLKEHNGDYLSSGALRQHPDFGIHAINIAPQFGVAETTSILKVCDQLGLGSAKKQFLSLALGSNKWVKWMEEGSTAGDYEKSVIAGHYVFNHPEFQNLKSEIQTKAKLAGMDLDAVIQEDLRNLILYIARCLKLDEIQVGKC